MKKKTRFLAVMMAVLMVLSCFSFSAFAQEEAYQSETIDVTVPCAEDAEIEYTAKESGWFVFYTDTEYDPWAMILDEYSNVVGSGDDSFDDYNFNMKAYLEKGKTYTLCVGLYDDVEEDTDLRVYVEKTQAAVKATVTQMPETDKVVKDLENDSLNLSGLEIDFEMSDGEIIPWSYEEYGTVDGSEVFYEFERNEDSSVVVKDGKALLKFFCDKAVVYLELGYMENPVKNIIYAGDPVMCYYEMGGEYFTDSNEEEFYYYEWRVPRNSDFIINFKDGHSEYYSDTETFVNASRDFYDDQWENHWGLGEHSITLSYMGAETTVPVYVVEKLVEGIEITKAPDKVVYDNYYYPLVEGAEVTLTLKDGSKKVLQCSQDRVTYKLDSYDGLVQVVDCGEFDVTVRCDYTNSEDSYIFECGGESAVYSGFTFEDNGCVNGAEILEVTDNKIKVKAPYENGTTQIVDFTTYVLEAYNFVTICAGVSQEGITLIDVLMDVDYEGRDMICVFGNYIDFAVTTNRSLLGDADENGRVNVKDATTVQKHTAEFITLSDYARILGDVDFNGKVNIKDATAIQKYVAGIDTGFLIGKPV